MYIADKRDSDKKDDCKKNDGEYQPEKQAATYVCVLHMYRRKKKQKLDGKDYDNKR